MKAKLFNLNGQPVGETELMDEVFAVKVKPEIVHSVFVAQSANQRQPWADTKNRGEVSGGGKKPWAQKGTGRARHGSIRSPIWKGGGVAFGPLTDRNYVTKINTKVRRLALKMCLSAKASEQGVFVVENYNFSDAKTKLFTALLTALSLSKKRVLVLTNGKEEKVLRMAANLPKVEVMAAADANVMAVLGAQAIVATPEGIAQLVTILKK